MDKRRCVCVWGGGGEQEWKENRSERWRWNTGGKARREHKEICRRTVKHARKCSKDGETKRNKQKRRDRKGSSERQHKWRAIKKDWQVKRETTEMYIPPGWYCHSVQQPSSNVLIMRASFETDNLVPIVQHAKHIPSPHLSLSAFSPWAHTIAVWWRLNDWRGNEVKRERVTGKHTLGEAGDVGIAKKNERKNRERAERRCGEHGLNAAAIKGAILCQRIC